MPGGISRFYIRTDPLRGGSECTDLRSGIHSDALNAGLSRKWSSDIYLFLAYFVFRNKREPVKILDDPITRVTSSLSLNNDKMQRGRVRRRSLAREVVLPGHTPELPDRGASPETAPPSHSPRTTCRWPRRTEVPG